MAKPVEFYTTERNGRLALWVDWGDGPRNIWDVPLSMGDNAIFRDALQFAFRRGLECAEAAYKKVKIPHTDSLNRPHYDKDGEYICWERREKP